MKRASGKTLAKALERNGWQLMRVAGSHHIYGRPDSRVRLSVPIHGSRDLKTGLASYLIKAAGLREEDL